MWSLIFTALVDGRAGMDLLGARLIRWQVGVHWCVAALLTMPAILLAILWLLSAAVDPAFSPRFQSLFAVGLLAGTFEEIGWTGFATPRLLARFALEITGLLLGFTWALWHLLVDFRYNVNSMGIAWPLEFAIVYLATLTPISNADVVGLQPQPKPVSGDPDAREFYRLAARSVPYDLLHAESTYGNPFLRSRSGVR